MLRADAQRCVRNPVRPGQDVLLSCRSNGHPGSLGFSSSPPPLPGGSGPGLVGSSGAVTSGSSSSGGVDGSVGSGSVVSLSSGASDVSTCDASSCGGGGGGSTLPIGSTSSNCSTGLPSR